VRATVAPSISVLAVAVDDVFTVKFVVLLKRFECTKAVSIEGERLLLADRLQESIRLRLSLGSRTAVWGLDRLE